MSMCRRTGEARLLDDTPVTESRQTVEDDADQTEVAFPASLEEAPIVVVKSPPAATQLASVTAKATGAGVLIGLEANGAIVALEAFTLEDPARLVVDLPGLAVGEGAEGVIVQSDFVSGVRVGAHDGKVRIVVDGGPRLTTSPVARSCPARREFGSRWAAVTHSHRQ